MRSGKAASDLGGGEMARCRSETMHNRTLPKTDQAFAMWSAHLIKQISSRYASYGISESMRDDAVAAETTFAAAYAIATNPLTRTRAAIAGKDDAAAAWRRVAGRIVALVRAQPNLSDADRIGLGLPPRAANVAIAVPNLAPSLVVLGIDGRTARLRADDNTTDRRGRPATAAGVVLFSHVGDEPSQDVRDWRYEGASSAVTLSVTFDAALPIGQLVWSSAQWLSPRLEAGPSATPVYAHLTHGVDRRNGGLRRAA